MLDKKTKKRLVELGLFAGGLIWLAITMTSKDEIATQVEATYFKECTAEELKNHDISSADCKLLLAETFNYCARNLRGNDQSYVPEDFVDHEIDKLRRCRTADLHDRIQREQALGRI